MKKSLNQKEQSMKKILLQLLLAVTCVAGAHAADLTKPHAYVNPTGNEFPIMAWYSVPGSDATPQRYKEMREAGFNLSFRGMDNADVLGKALDASKGTGVKIMASCNGMFEHTAEVVNRFKGHESVGGWFLIDEPQVPQFKSLADYAKRIRTADDSHVLYLNLFPYPFNGKNAEKEAAAYGAKSYVDYVRQFIDTVRLGLVSFDMYPVVTNGGYLHLKPEYYHCLEVISAEARRAGQPFWAFSLATPHHTYESQYPLPTREHVRLQIFSDLAYGAQGIQYFTYWNPGHADFEYDNAAITDGRRTEMYDILSELNHEVQRLSWVFLGAKVTDVSHTGDSIAWRTKPLKSLPAQFKEVSTSGSDVIVSQLTNGNNRFLMVVNADIVARQKVTVVADESVERVLPSGKTVKANCYKPQLWLNPGDYLLYKY